MEWSFWPKEVVCHSYLRQHIQFTLLPYNSLDIPETVVFYSGLWPRCGYCLAVVNLAQLLVHTSWNVHWAIRLSQENLIFISKDRRWKFVRNRHTSENKERRTLCYPVFQVQQVIKKHFKPLTPSEWRFCQCYSGASLKELPFGTHVVQLYCLHFFCIALTVLSKLLSAYRTFFFEHSSCKHNSVWQDISRTLVGSLFRVIATN